MAQEARQVSKRWRDTHPATTALLNKRMGHVRKLCWKLVRDHMPEAYARFKQDAKRKFPAWMSEGV